MEDKVAKEFLLKRQRKDLLPVRLKNYMSYPFNHISKRIYTFLLPLLKIHSECPAVILCCFMKPYQLLKSIWSGDFIMRIFQNPFVNEQQNL